MLELQLLRFRIAIVFRKKRRVDTLFGSPICEIRMRVRSTHEKATATPTTTVCANEESESRVNSPFSEYLDIYLS